MSTGLQDAGLVGDIQFRIREDGETERFRLRLREDGCTVVVADDELPCFEILTSGCVWDRLAAGELSPVRAFLEGQLRVRGDVEVGQAMLKHLSKGEGIVDPCRRS